jgi:hypothetical protein
MHILCYTALILISSSLFAAGLSSTTSAPIANLSINGTKFEDRDFNGLQSDGEIGLQGWTIKLMQNGIEILNTTTDGRGAYCFLNLLPGTYEIAEESVTGWNQTAPGGGRHWVTLTDKPAQRLDFGNRPSNSFTSASPSRTYPVMRFNPQEARRWIVGYRTASKAYLSPQIDAELVLATGEAFSLLDYLPYTPAERDQGACGNCWAWAGTGAMEIDNAFKNGIEDRLSIQYLNSNFWDGSGPDWACCGGSLEDVAAFYSTRGMAIPWSNANAHWQDGNRYCTAQASSVSAGSISTNPRYTLTSIQAVAVPTQGVGKEAAIANIKNVLHQGKAVWFGFFLPNEPAWSDFTDFWGWESEESIWQPDSACGESYNYYEGGGHAVLCVGYDDTDPSNRYWIMLNSWGAPFNRPSGLFRMSMDMNYDCYYPNLDFAFYWMALNIAYPSGPNNAPTVPAAPSGPNAGYRGTSYSYSTSSTDPDGDTVKYIFDWGDGTSSETALVNSDASASASHIWNEAGDYVIKAMAQDSRGLSSGFSPSITVAISGTNLPPAVPAMPSGPTTGYASVNYAYVTSATDPDGDFLSYTFDWGDGTSSQVEHIASGTSASTSHAWKTAGTYYVKVKAADGNAGVSPWSSLRAVKINANRLPAAPAISSGPTAGVKGASCSYSAYAADPDKDKVKYTFDWGDGTFSDTMLVKSGSKASAAHIWNNPGAYPVKVRATDSKGGASLWSGTLMVNIADNEPPNIPATPSGPVSGRARISYKYSTSATDPDGNTVKYSFDWGDGTSLETAFVNSGTSAFASHSWKKVGTFYIKARAIDNKGVSSGPSASLMVRISSTGQNSPPIKPSKPSGPGLGHTGVLYRYKTYATDPNGDLLSYTVDWGDGSSSEAGPARPGRSIEVGHSWIAPGTYAIRAEAQDDVGGSSGWSTSTTITIV